MSCSRSKQQKTEKVLTSNMFSGRENLSEPLLQQLTARNYGDDMDKVIDSFGADGMEYVISVVTVLEAGTSAIRGKEC